MAKRFTDSEKFQKLFFKGLPASYKLLWEYILCDCDCAGIWIVESDIAQLRIGREAKIDIETALNLFNKDEQRVVVLENGIRWFVTGFIKFQYGKLRVGSSVYRGVYNRLKMYGLENQIDWETGDFIPMQPLPNPLDNPYPTLTQRVKDKDKDKDMDKDKDNKELELFEEPTVVVPTKKEITEKVFEMFKRCCPSLPQPQSLSDKRVEHTPVRVEEIGGLEKVEELLKKVEESDYLAGRKIDFRASYDWIFCYKNNWIKVAEGNYDNKPTEKGMQVGQVLHGGNGVSDEKLNF